jgi:hypothetical protein
MTDWTVSGHIDGAAVVSGALHTPRQRMEGSSLNSTGSTKALAIGWHTPANFPHSQGVAPIPDAVGVHAELLTPSDLKNYDVPFRWLWIGGTGDVAVKCNDGSCFLFSSVPAGTRLPISITMLFSITTATNVIGVR